MVDEIKWSLSVEKESKVICLIFNYTYCANKYYRNVLE